MIKWSLMPGTGYSSNLCFNCRGNYCETILSTITAIFVMRYLSELDYSLLNIHNNSIHSGFGWGIRFGLRYDAFFSDIHAKEHNEIKVKNVIRINLIIKFLVGISFTMVFLVFAKFIALVFPQVSDSRFVLLLQLFRICDY